MPTTRISEPTRLTLRQLAEESGEPMQSILEQAVEAFRRRRLLEQSNHAFETLREDPEGWKQEQAERRAWDATLADDLGGD